MSSPETAWRPVTLAGGVWSALPQARSTSLTTAARSAAGGATTGQTMLCRRTSKASTEGTASEKSPVAPAGPKSSSSTTPSPSSSTPLSSVRFSAQTGSVWPEGTASIRLALAPPVAMPLWTQIAGVAPTSVPEGSITVTAGGSALFIVVPAPPSTGCSETRM